MPDIELLNLVERHPFGIFIPDNARYLLLGSFPCNRNLRLSNAQPEYGEWFYCGSGKSTFWAVMERVYHRQIPPSDRESKVRLFAQLRMAITDVALEIERKKTNCLDASLKIREHNTVAIAKAFSYGKIEKVFCTSRFVAAQFNCHVKPHLPTDEFAIEYLISPSPAANKSITSRSDYQEFIERNPSKTLTDFRVEYYRARLPKLA